jgi:hypothetical protein
MSTLKPQGPDEYFQETEHAVKHEYEGLHSCWRYYDEALQHATPPIEEAGMLRRLPPRTPEEKAKLERSLELLHKYAELKFSEALFAGSILQAAYVAIRLYSRNTSIPTSCVEFKLPKAAIPFCIGEQRHGVPTGLIVYAGRNQYAHWDDEKPLEPTRRIFSALNRSFINHPFSDLAFELGNPTINIYAGEILLTALGWTSYDKYLAEMNKLLS